MKKITKVILLAALAWPMMAGAAEFQWLTFKMADGSEMSVAADGLAINYSEGSLLLKSATVDESIATANISSMRFTTEAAAVEGISDILSSQSEYFDLSGVRVGIFESLNEARKALPAGTYIMRSNNKTIKVIF